jgi:hypothetical protein
MKTRTTRSGLEDRIISVTPVASLQDQEPTAGYIDDNEKDVRKGWLLKMGGGKYNDIEQRVEIEMVCDNAAKEVRSSGMAESSCILPQSPMLMY